MFTTQPPLGGRRRNPGKPRYRANRKMPGQPGFIDPLQKVPTDHLGGHGAIISGFGVPRSNSDRLDLVLQPKPGMQEVVQLQMLDQG